MEMTMSGPELVVDPGQPRHHRSDAASAITNTTLVTKTRDERPDAGVEEWRVIASRSVYRASFNHGGLESSSNRLVRPVADAGLLANFRSAFPIMFPRARR